MAGIILFAFYFVKLQSNRRGLKPFTAQKKSFKDYLSSIALHQLFYISKIKSQQNT